MDKRTAIKRLHAMIDTRMFGESSWLADRDACISIHEQLKHLELEVETDGSSSATALGKALQLDLAMVFLGTWHEWEIPRVLEQYGLIDESDELLLYDQLDDNDDPEQILRPWVERAFFDHFNPSGRTM